MCAGLNDQFEGYHRLTQDNFERLHKRVQDTLAAKYIEALLQVMGGPTCITYGTAIIEYLLWMTLKCLPKKRLASWILMTAFYCAGEPEEAGLPRGFRQEGGQAAGQGGLWPRQGVPQRCGW